MGYIFTEYSLKQKERVVKGDPFTRWPMRDVEQSKQWISLCKNDAKYVTVTGLVIIVYCDVALLFNHLRESFLKNLVSNEMGQG